jgi:hypothetical protein
MTRSNARRNIACFSNRFFVEETRSKSRASHAYGTDALVEDHSASRSSSPLDVFPAAFASDPASPSPGGRGGGVFEPVGFAHMTCRAIVGPSRPAPLAPAAASARTTGVSCVAISRFVAGHASSAGASRASDALDAHSGFEAVP